MSTKIAFKNTASNGGISKKYMEQRKNFEQYLKLLGSGELCLSDVEAVEEELKLKPHFGDHMQYELHKYCQKDFDKTNADLVIKLAKLCYCQVSVIHFNNIDRFVGCVYYISSYLLKKKKYKSAIDVVHSLLIKKNEILKCSETESDIRTFLCNLHSSLIATAIILASKIQSLLDEEFKISHNLAMESLKILKLTNVKQPEIGRKVVKTFTLYFQTIRHYKDEDVLLCYKTLSDILKILLPSIQTFDYFFYYLQKMSQFKNSDSEAEIYQVLKRTIHLLTLFLDCSPQIQNSLNRVLDFFWNKIPLEFCINDEDLKVLMKDSCSKLFFILVSHIFSYGMQFLWKKYEKSWSENVSVAFVQKSSRFIMKFHKSHFGISELYCSPGKEPFSTCFGDLLTGNLQKIQYTVRLCFKNKVPNALPLVSISREAFKLSMECLELINSNGCCPEQRMYSWKFSVIHHRNTVEDIYRQPSSDETWLYLKECSYEILREIINSNVELPFDFKSVNILFHRWHMATLKLKNFYDALYACVVYYAFYPKEEKEIMSMWLQTKSESSNEIFEEITMSEIFKTFDKNLREFSRTYNGSQFFLKSVLLMELKAYSMCPPDTFQNPNTTYNLATRIWKQLEKYKLDLWETSTALCSLISAIIVGDNEKLTNNLLERCRKLIDELMNWKREEKVQCRSLLHAANLTFSLFLHKIKMAENSEEKMDTTQMVLGFLKKAEEEKVKFGEDIDFNLTCDIIPSSNHLTVELETNYLNELNKIVDLWSNAIKSNFDESPSELEFDFWLENVKQVAYLYELIGEYQRSFTTWILFYKIGKKCNNAGATLLGLVHLIENCTDIDESGMKEEAEVISGQLGSETTEKYILVEYSLAVTTNYLKNKKFDKCLEYLSIAKKLLESLRTTIKTYVLNAKFWCLVSKFLAVYKEFEAVFDYPAGTDLRVMAFKAFSYANGGGRSDLIKSVTQSDCTELVLTMLEVNLWAYYLYGVYRQTDFMRFFLDDLYQIVQKLFLPTRTAEMLVRLAEVDMICEKMSDCHGKVSKLKSILTTVSSRRCSEIVTSEKPTSAYLSIPQKNEHEGSIVRPISPARFLDKRPPSIGMDTSPVHYYLNDVKSSKDTEHVKKCKCRLCQNLLIQTLTMNTIWLEADICNMENNTKQAAKCYSQAYEILNKLELLRAEQSKILLLEMTPILKEIPGELDFKLASIEFHCTRFLIKYALFESSRLKTVTENVTKTVLRISKLMKKFSYEDKLLQWTFTELKLFCFVLNQKETKPAKKSTPVQLKVTSVAQTPLVNAPSTNVPSRKKNIDKFKRSPLPCAHNRKISFEDDRNSDDDPMNIAFVEADKLKIDQKTLQPRKLNFHEPETNTKTVRKACKEKVSCIQSRKLDFEQSEDLFVDKEKDKPKKETPVSKRSLRQNRKTVLPPVKTKKSVIESVKIYTDLKDDMKATKSVAVKGQNKARKM